MLSKQSRDRQCAANGGCEAILSVWCRKTSRPTTNATLIDGLSCCTGLCTKIGLRSAYRFNGRFLVLGPRRGNNLLRIDYVEKEMFVCLSVAFAGE